MRQFCLSLLFNIPFILLAQGPGGVSSNLSLWFKANSGVTVTGENLTNWADQSGNLFNITQGASANQPVQRIGGINFNPEIVFDGNNDYLPISSKNFSGTGAISALTTFIVFKTDYTGGGYNGNWSFLDFDRSDFFNFYIRGDDGRLAFSYHSGPTHDNDGATMGFNDGFAHLGVAIFDNTVTDETKIRVDGLEDFSGDNVSNGATIGVPTTRYGFIGDGSEATFEDGARNNAYFDGSIAEVILFESSLTPVLLSRVESYLAVKYGLTLGDGTSPVDYVASNGSTIWTGSATYQHGVAGVGRDDNSQLLQERSTNSTEESAIIVEVESSFSSDLTFLMWGHDDAGNGLTTSNLPGGFEERVQKTWMAQVTGTPGTLTVDFIISNTGFNSFIPEDYNLLIDGDGDFTTGASSVGASTIIGDTLRFTSVSLNDGDFFTLAGPAIKAPGGFSSGLSLWYRADGAIGAIDGFVYELGDLSINDNDATQSNASSRPAYVESDFNYNPGVSFDDIDDYLPISKLNYTGTGSLSNVLTFVVYKTTTSGSSNDNWAFLDFDRSEYFNFNIKGDGELRFSYTVGGTIYDLDGTATGMNDGTPGLATAYYDNSLVSETEIRANGERDHLSNNVANGSTIGSTMTRFGMIGDGSEATSFDAGRNDLFYGGEIAEIIYFENQVFTAPDIQILESYLALKYGLTLSPDTDGNGMSLEAPNAEGVNEGDYLSSGSITVWDASASDGYGNEIIGLARDDASGLFQKQSHSNDDSLRVYLQTLQTSNKVNTATKLDFGSDESFLIIGHDAGALYDSGIKYGEWPAGVYNRIDREWRIQNTNFTGTISLDFTLDPLSNISSIDPNDVVLMVDTDGNFGDASFYGTADGLSVSIAGNQVTIGGISNANVPANSSSYFTLGVNDPAASLPIELVSFDGALEGDVVLLNWVVATEINNNFFTIERSTDGIDWEIVGSVDGAGNSEEETRYTYRDRSPLDGTSFYRLKQTDFDGKLEYFNPIRIVNKRSKITVFPNPAYNELFIQNGGESVRVSIYNLTGDLILQQFVTHSLDISSIKNGIYIAVVDQNSFTIRIQH